MSSKCNVCRKRNSVKNRTYPTWNIPVCIICDEAIDNKKREIPSKIGLGVRLIPFDETQIEEDI